MKILKQTTAFRLYQTGNRYFVRTVGKRFLGKPAGRRVSKVDAKYLMELSTKGRPSSFDCACVLDMGVAVWAR